jgi:GxxExxY protein
VRAENVDDITDAIIGAAVEVHRHLGPGLLESVYEECLCHELGLRQIPFERQRPLTLDYKGVQLPGGRRLDLVVLDTVVVELKAVELLHPVYKAQLLSYLRLGNWPAGLLINFHEPVLVKGVRRVSLHLPMRPTQTIL